MHTVELACNLAETTGKLPHFWEHTVGSGHALLALRADWQAQLRRCHAELGFQHIRFHGILCDDVGTLVEEQGRLLDSFFNVDQIWDFLLSIGMKPFVELSFMPRALASGNTIVFHYRANVTPPRHYRQWARLIRKLVGHWVQRYGIAEVRTWFFEVWNEPNLQAFWPTTRAKYFKLYRHTVQAIKDVDASLQVGGPATARDEWISQFLAYCDQHRLPVDFISTHHYPTDALGTAGEDTVTQLAHSRRSLLREWAQNSRRRARDKPLYYTEWNASSNPRDPLHDEPYTAPVVIKTMLEANGLADGYSFWTFSDIFEEDYFPSVPFHGGFGLLNLHGIAKPSYRAFELLHRLGSEQLLVDGLHETVDSWVVRQAGAVTVLLTNHALPRHAIYKENVHVQLTGAPPPRATFIERIDQDHANAKRHWQEMGKPEYLNRHDVDQLQQASALERQPYPCQYAEGTIHLEVEMPPDAVATVTIQFAPESSGENGQS
jgi:xylan 1,4-beta-xylosidase